MKYILWIFLISFPSITVADIQSDVEDILRTEYPSEYEISLNKFELPEEVKSQAEKQVQQKFFKSYIYLWKICRDDSLAGYAVLDNTYGKSLPITFLVIFSPSGIILRTDIIRYREPYGGAIVSRRWLDQFVDKSVKDDYRVDQDIDSISGATISANSVTRAINKLTYIIDYIISENNFDCYKKHLQAESDAK
jgi:Na+-translocating ferredoxin:NAD+ oxidoreductase RnfG subunit